MPTANAILTWASEAANEWRVLAIGWHIALASLVLMCFGGWRPSHRVLGYLLALPILSVSIVAWLTTNAFNGLMFTVLASVLGYAAARLPSTAVAPESRGWVVPGAALLLVGSTYPHFLQTNTWAAYAYASPFGILPCPTLAVVTAITVIFGGLRSAVWSLAVVAAGVTYGFIGVFWLRVPLDVALLAGAGLLGAMVVVNFVFRPVRAVRDERTRRLPGDELISGGVGTLTHAITIGGSRRAVWPWLVQMGAGSRAGWYSYDSLDNGRRTSATRIVPEWQHPTLGSVFPALPGIKEGFVLLAMEPERYLILGWPNRDGSPQVTWAFVLEPRVADATRLIVRVRADHGYRFHGLPVWLSEPAIRLVHFVMQRKQLLGIAQRVESSRAAFPDAA